MESALKVNRVSDELELIRYQFNQGRGIPN